jgi:hypothetical protein
MRVVESLPAPPAAATTGGTDSPAWAGSLQRMLLLDLVARADRASADELASAVESMGADLFEAEMRAIFGDA